MYVLAPTRLLLLTTLYLTKGFIVLTGTVVRQYVGPSNVRTYYTRTNSLVGYTTKRVRGCSHLPAMLNITNMACVNQFHQTRSRCLVRCLFKMCYICPLECICLTENHENWLGFLNGRHFENKIKSRWISYIWIVTRRTWLWISEGFLKPCICLEICTLCFSNKHVFNFPFNLKRLIDICRWFLS